MERKIFPTLRTESTFPPITPTTPKPRCHTTPPIPAAVSASPAVEDGGYFTAPPLLPVLSGSSRLDGSFTVSEQPSPCSPPLPTLSSCSGPYFAPDSALPFSPPVFEDGLIPSLHEFHYVAEPQHVKLPRDTTVLTVVWDLDETLVDARDYRRGATRPTTVHVRPCFAELITACSKPGIEIVVWTASVLSHATAIMEELRPYFLGRNCWPKSIVHRGAWASRTSYCKDISLLNGYAPGRFLIFDNSREVIDCEHTRPCALLVPDFRFDFMTSLVADNTLHIAARCVKRVYDALTRRPGVSVGQVLTEILALPPNVIAAIGDSDLYDRARLQKEAELAELMQREKAIRGRGTIRQRGGIVPDVPEDATPSRPPRLRGPT